MSTDYYPPPPKHYLYGKNLKKPDLPEGDTFRVFGAILSTKLGNLTIKKPGDDNVKELFDDTKINDGRYCQTRLKELLREVLNDFLELLGILTKNPMHRMKETDETSITTEVADNEKTAIELKTQQIQLKFINMSYLLNNFRPHQARYQLKQIMEAQLKRRKEAYEKMVECLHRNEVIIQECIQTLAKEKEKSAELDVESRTQVRKMNRKRKRNDFASIDQELEKEHEDFLNMLKNQN